LINGQLRFDKQMYHSIPKTRTLKRVQLERFGRKWFVCKRTNSILEMLQLFMGRESNEHVNAQIKQKINRYEQATINRGRRKSFNNFL
jgi:ubiquitin-protein ligase